MVFDAVVDFNNKCSGIISISKNIKKIFLHIELYTDKCLPHNFKNYGAELKIMAPNLLIYA